MRKRRWEDVLVAHTGSNATRGARGRRVRWRVIEVEADGVYLFRGRGREGEVRCAGVCRAEGRRWLRMCQVVMGGRMGMVVGALMGVGGTRFGVWRPLAVGCGRGRRG